MRTVTSRVRRIDRTSLDSPKWCIFPFLFIIQNDMQKISIIGECLKVAQISGSLAHLRPFLAQNLQYGVFSRIVSYLLIAYSDKWVKSK